MTISNAINNALSGLRANGRMSEVTAGNLANALTPGYGRQSVQLGASVTGTQGTGVRVNGVARALDPELSEARRQADGELAGRDAVLQALTELERGLGELDDPGSLTNRLGAFEGALRQLGETPESGPRQQAAAEAARDLADTFNRIAGRTVELRGRTDRAIGAAVEDLSADLGAFARLNRQIQIATAAGRETAPMIDQRERLIDRIAQAVPLRQSMREDGVVELRTREGVMMADITARPVEYATTPVYEPGLSYAAGAGTLSGLAIAGTDVTPGGPGSQAIRDGRLAGLFEVRDATAPEFERRLDSLAADLITRLGDPAVDPSLAPGDAGLFTDRGGAFALADITGIASRIELNAAVDPAAGGYPARLRDGMNAAAPGPVSNDAVIRALSEALSADRDVGTPPATPGLAGELSLADSVGGIVELTSMARVSSEAETSSLSNAREVLANEEATRLGVDSDEELSQLVQIEQAYSANAQVIRAASRMLDELTRIGS
jgi:flagellar hook-associated protein 1 FlgK